MTAGWGVEEMAADWMADRGVAEAEMEVAAVRAYLRTVEEVAMRWHPGRLFWYSTVRCSGTHFPKYSAPHCKQKPRPVLKPELQLMA